MPSISLCMIARNEEALLAGCLESVRGTVREIILVDTGSTDRTAELAREAGARVVAYAWNDDFSGARNAGIALAKGSHVLILDADERLGPGASRALTRAARDPELLLGSLPLHNATSLDARHADVVSGEKRRGDPVFVPRFFPNKSEMRYTRRVHETLGAGFNRLHARGAGLSKAVEAPLIHYGDVPSLRARRGKDDRNERLLRLSLQEDPSDGELAGYLVVHLLRDEQLDEARAVGERHLAPFLVRIDERPRGHLPENTVRIGYALAHAQLLTGAPDAALATARACAARAAGPHPNLLHAEGCALEALGELTEAADRFRACLEHRGTLHAQTILPGLTHEVPRLKLANLALQRGAPDEALRWCEDVEGRWVLKAALLSAEADLARQEPESALQRLAPLVDLQGLPPDYHALAHVALTQLGQRADELLEAAQNAPEERWIETRRRSALAARG